MADAKITVSAQDQASRVLSQVRGSLEQVNTVASRVGNAIGLIGAAGVSGLALMVKSAIDSVDALNDLKDATGASIENISALEDVAIRTGTSMDTVSTALVKFNGVLKDATPGSGADAVLKSIGLSAKELKALDPAEALLQTAKALAGFADDGNKARITQELFGKSLKDVAPFLKDLADKGELVATVTTEQADQAERFNKELFNLQKNASDAGRSLAGDLVTGINAAAKAYRESGLWQAMKTLFMGDDQHKSNVRLVALTEELGPLENEIAQLKGSAISLDAALLRSKQERLKVLRQEIDTEMDYRKVLEGPATVDKPLPSAPDASGKPKPAGGKSQAQKDREEFERERMKMQRQSAMDEGDAVIAANQAYQKSLIDQADAADKFIQSLQKEQIAQDDATAKMREAVEEIGLTTEQVNALRLARLDSNIELEQQNQLAREELGLSAEVLNYYQKRLEQMREQRELTARGQIATAGVETKKDQEQASKDYAKGVHDDLKGALSAAFRDTNDPLAAFGDALSNVIYTRAATALAESMATSILGTGGSGAGGGLLSSLFSFDGGGYTGSGSRSGGIDGKGGFMAVMHPDESVIDHTRGQGTSSQVINVTQNFTVGDVASVSMVRQAVAGSERRIAGAMGRSQGYGGSLS